jgi:hypothetical protein
LLRSARRGARGKAATKRVTNPYWIIISRYSSNRLIGCQLCNRLKRDILKGQPHELSLLYTTSRGTASFMTHQKGSLFFSMFTTSDQSAANSATGKGIQLYGSSKKLICSLFFNRLKRQLHESSKSLIALCSALG